MMRDLAGFFFSPGDGVPSLRGWFLTFNGEYGSIAPGIGSTGFPILRNERSTYLVGGRIPSAEELFLPAETNDEFIALTPVFF